MSSGYRLICGQPYMCQLMKTYILQSYIKHPSNLCEPLMAGGYPNQGFVSDFHNLTSLVNIRHLMFLSILCV
jgi:hypothetical protein